MIYDILTLFPLMFEGTLNQSILKIAQEKKAIEINVYNIRDFTHDKHRQVDDYPYGGGSGMLLKPEPIFEAVDYLIQKRGKKGKVILFTPQGDTFNQKEAYGLVEEDNLILICGHYEGVDDRVRQELVDKEISIGDYILTGGELPAMVLVDTVTRLIPGVLGNYNSIKDETFSDSLFEYPQYTRPAVFRGLKVPEVLLSGNHKEITKWRRDEAIKRTREKRPELLNLPGE
ncbi:MAG: tRNA (guanosine(37)-N1)-methyltransferase TrmD [bacterium]